MKLTDQELENLYTQVTALANNIPLNQRLDRADASATVVSPLCGSQITVDIRMIDGKITEFGQLVRACTLGAATAAIVAEQIIGQDEKNMITLRDEMYNMLKHEGVPPMGVWTKLKLLLPARDLPARHGSIMLIFNATIEAMKKYRGVADTEQIVNLDGFQENIRL